MKKSEQEERQAHWEKSNKEWGPKNGEIVRDKFPQAFKEYVLNKGKELVKTPAIPSDSIDVESAP